MDEQVSYKRLELNKADLGTDVPHGAPWPRGHGGGLVHV